ncbi:Galactose operon repressor [Lacticaseibacillus rhamnosus MTCC 5462]|nr:Galactose operon repressor [Lacticaseibacillus rhamnosus MTCC 5462]
MRRPRTIAFKDFMSSHTSNTHSTVLTGDFSIESGYTKMKDAISKLGDKLPTAFLSKAIQWRLEPSRRYKKPIFLCQSVLALSDLGIWMLVII